LPSSEGLPLKAIAHTILINKGLSSKSTLPSQAHGKVAKSEIDGVELDGVEYSRRDLVDVGGLVELLG